MKKTVKAFGIFLMICAFIFSGAVLSFAAADQVPDMDCCITFDPNGGTYEGHRKATEKTMGLHEVYDNPGIAERKGYTFEGWYTGKIGGKKVYNRLGKSMGCLHWDNARDELWEQSKDHKKLEMKLYAHWEKGDGSGITGDFF